MVMVVTMNVKSRKDSIVKVDHQQKLVHVYHSSLIDHIFQQLVQCIYSEELSKEYV